MLPSKLECGGTGGLATGCKTILFSVIGIHWLLYEFTSKVIISEPCPFSLRWQMLAFGGMWYWSHQALLWQLAAEEQRGSQPCPAGLDGFPRVCFHPAVQFWLRVNKITEKVTCWFAELSIKWTVQSRDRTNWENSEAHCSDGWANSPPMRVLLPTAAREGSGTEQFPLDEWKSLGIF